MRQIFSPMFAVAVLLGSATGASAAQPPRMLMPDAREQIPAGFLGMWKVDDAASSPGRTPLAIQLRSFQLTSEGQVLVSFVNINHEGRQTLGHWALQVDGETAGYEYRSDNGSTPIAVLHVKLTDPNTLELENSVAGKLASSAVYKLSADGQTLTLTREPKSQKPVVIVYRKWSGR